MSQAESSKINQNNLKMCQQYYFEGRALKEQGDIKGAIAAFKAYSTWLEPEDQYIPHQWIHDLYLKLGDEQAALAHLSIHAEGCSDLRAADTFKEVGSAYEKLGMFEEALQAYESAITKNPKLGITKKIEQLKSLILEK